MKLIKKLFALFSPLEMIILMVSITISTLLVVPTFTAKKEEVPLLLFPTERVYSVEGGKQVAIFDTSFFIVYEVVKEKKVDEISEILNEYLVTHHKLFDRHHDYFAIDPADPVSPTATEKATLPRIKNLKYINDHKGEVIEIEKALYDLLLKSKEFSINTPHNAFSMFIGELYDYWKPYTSYINADPANDPLYHPAKQAEIARLVSYIPKNETDINNTLELWTENDKYYVRFNEFNSSGDDLSISVGAVAKGLMTDILGKEMRERKLTKGLVFGGQSSLLFLENGFRGKPYNITMESIGPGEYTFMMSRLDQYQMSTSGIYAGYKFPHENKLIIRSHIIDPLTGYPIQNDHHMVNLVSDTLSGLELDYLTTALTVLKAEDGVAFLNEKYGIHDVNLMYGGFRDEEWFVTYSPGYPGGELPSLTIDSEYSGNVIELIS